MSNLRDTIRQALTECDSPDPYEVAALVDRKLGSRDVRAALRELLPTAVREVIRSERGTAPADEPTPAPTVNGKRDLGAMTKDPWRMRVWVPDSGWKFKGDLTADDCGAIADDYAARATQMRAHAAEWRALAQRMRESGAPTLRALSTQTSEVAA